MKHLLYKTASSEPKTKLLINQLKVTDANVANKTESDNGMSMHMSTDSK